MAKIARTTDGTTVFWCPGCDRHHGVNSRTWAVTGSDDAPTISPSVLVKPSGNGYIKRCHSFVRDGMIEFLSDSEHELAGQAVPLPDLNPEVWGDDA